MCLKCKRCSFKTGGGQNPSWIAELALKEIENQKEEKGQDEPDAKCEGRKRLREGGSQTDDDLKHVEPKLSTSHHIDAMNVKLDELLVACSEIKTLKNEIGGLGGELRSLKDSLDFANWDLETLQAGCNDTFLVPVGLLFDQHW